MRFGLLGSLEVTDGDGAPVEVGGAQPRLVLAVLLAAEGRPVAVDAILDALWGDAQPASAAGTLQSYVSRLRRVLEPERARGAPATVLVSEGAAYRLVVDADAVDFRRFECLADRGHAELADGRPDQASATLREAESLWRGPVLAQAPDVEALRGLATRLEERRVAALEERIEADLALGRHGAMVAELTTLVDEHPLREGLRAHLALALYRSGRQADALRAIDDARRTLVEELGVDPGPRLRELEGRILAQDASLDAPAPPPAGATPRRRRTDVEPGGGPGDATGGDAAAAPPAPAVPALIGRRHELGQLLAALDEARTSARMVVVEGEPGIGKTRLAEEVADEGERRGAMTLVGRSMEGGAAPAFWPWLGVLRSLVASASPSDGSPEPPDHAPGLLGQVLAPQGEVDDQVLGSARFQLFEEVATAVAASARHRPLVIVLDDVQWADQASLDLLCFLAGRLVDEPVLVLATVRELEVGRNDAVVDALVAVGRRPSSRRLHLRGLTAQETGRLLAQATGRDVDDAVADAIHARAEGNPFFATELARLLADDAELDDAAAVTASDVPAGVRDVVRQRVGRLPPATVELLQVCAVVGRDADLSVVASATDRAMVDCLADLEPALLQRLLVEVPGQPGTVRFSHALVREVVADELSSLRRARVHLLVADAIEAVEGAGDDQAEILAEHLWAASAVGVGRRAADALGRAAQVAFRRMAYEAGDDLLVRALQLRRSAGSAPDDLAAELGDILELLGVRRAVHGYASLNDDPLIGRGKELARRLGDERQLVKVLYMEWSGYDTACLYDRGGVIAEQLWATGRDTEDLALRHIAYQVWGVHCWHLGRIGEARDNLVIAAGSAERPEGVSQFVVDSESWLLGNTFATYIRDMAGDLPAEEVEARFEAMALQHDEPFLQSIIATFAAAGAAVRGDAERAVRWARRTLAADVDEDFAFWNGTARGYLGASLVDVGEVEEGLPILRAGIELCTSLNIRTNLGAFLAARARGEVASGDLDAAEATVAEAEHGLETDGERWPLPIILEAKAILRSAQGADPDEVAGILGEAAAVATEQGSLGMLERFARTAASLGLPAPA